MNEKELYEIYAEIVNANPSKMQIDKDLLKMVEVRNISFDNQTHFWGVNGEIFKNDMVNKTVLDFYPNNGLVFEGQRETW